MTPFHADQLNMISSTDNNEYDRLFNMSPFIFGNSPHGVQPHRASYNSTGGGNIAAWDNGEVDEQGAWASDVPGNMPDIGVYSNPGRSEMFGHPYDNTYARENHHDATFADVFTRSYDQYEGNTAVTDHVDDNANLASMNDPIGLQASRALVEVEPSVKIEEHDEGTTSVSFTPSYGGDHDEYDESDESDEGSFVGCGVKPIPKTNKDGARRKPRQPRSKLLKWSDNDWKNVVLGIIWACGETGTQIPFDQAAQLVGETCTAGALQQAVLKLRQKQVAEGNWIPALRMAWTRKSKNVDPLALNANDAKVTKEAGQAKTMLSKKKASRFSGNQTCMVTIKRAYRETDRAHLATPHKLAADVGDIPGLPNMDISAEPRETLRQKRRRLQISTTGSPQLLHDAESELKLDVEKVEARRKARVNHSVLFEYTPYCADTFPNGIPTPELTYSLNHGSEFETPSTGVSPGNEFVLAQYGPLTWTPYNTRVADSTLNQHLQSRALNPQGLLPYEAYTTSVDPFAIANDMDYDQGQGHRMVPGTVVSQAQDVLDAARGGAKDNPFSASSTAEDPFTS